MASSSTSWGSGRSVTTTATVSHSLFVLSFITCTNIEISRVVSCEAQVEMFGIVRQPIVSIRSILSLQSSAISTAVRNTTQCSFHKQSVASKWSSQIAQHQTLRSIVQQHGPVSRAISLKKCSRPLFNQSKLFFSNSTTKTQPRNTGPNNRQQEYREYDDYEIVQRSAVQYITVS